MENRVPVLGYYKPYFDTVQAVAIALVLLHHSPPLASNRVLSTFQNNGWFGVEIFFVLSGFLITSILQERQSNPNLLISFLGRRFIRMAPAYFLVLCAEIVLVVVFGLYSNENQILFREKLPFSLLFAGHLHAQPTAGPFFQAWSLAAEVQFYIAAGVAMLWSWRLFGTLAIILLTGKVLLFNIVGPWFTLDQVWRVSIILPEAILIGVLLAFIKRSIPRAYALLTRLPPWLPACLVFLVLFVYPINHASSLGSLALYFLTAIAVADVDRKPQSKSSILATSATSIGKVSYGIYLFHMIVIAGSKHLLDQTSTALIFGTALALSTFFAAASYDFFEFPLVRKAKEWENSRLMRSKQKRIQLLPI